MIFPYYTLTWTTSSSQNMIITEEMKKQMPLLTEEELKEIKCSKEELIEYAINEFNKGADEIDALYD